MASIVDVDTPYSEEDRLGSRREFSQGKSAKWRRLKIHMRWFAVGALVGVTVLAVARLYIAYSTGCAAADAALEEYMGIASLEFQPPLEGNSLGSLIQRAGRGKQGLATAQNTPEAWAQRLADFAEEELEQTRASNATAEILTHRVPVVRATPLRDWDELWLKEELNKVAREHVNKLNDDMYDIVKAKMKGYKLPRNKHLIMDSFEGVETLYIDDVEAYDVTSHLDEGFSTVAVRIKVHTGTLTGRGRFRLATIGEYFSFVFNVYDFRLDADNVQGDFNWEQRTIPRAKVSWVNAHYSHLDGTCYQKSRPKAKDGFCTKVMNKKLAEKKGFILHTLSEKVTAGIQNRIDERLPLHLGRSQQS